MSQLHPDFPVVHGRHQMTAEWAVTLPARFNRRIEDGSLVLWRPGMTIWLIVWGNDNLEPIEARLQAIQSNASPEAEDQTHDRIENIRYFGYKLEETSDRGTVHAWYCFAFNEGSQVQASIYFDDPAQINQAKEIWLSLTDQPLTTAQTGPHSKIPSPELKAFVSVMALAPGQQVRWAILDNPEGDEDSGWSLFSGMESTEYANNPKNIRLCELGWLAERDFALKTLFLQTLAGGYERQDDNSWSRAEDWEPDDEDDADSE